MVRRDSQQTHEVTVTVGRATSGLGDSRWVDGVRALGRLDAQDFFPFQTMVTVQLPPAQLPYSPQGIDGCMAFRFLQSEEIVLSRGAGPCSALAIGIRRNGDFGSWACASVQIGEATTGRRRARRGSPGAGRGVAA